MALPFGRQEDADMIQAQTLGTTTLAGAGAAVAGLGGAVTALLPQIAAVDVPVRLQIAGLLVVGLAIIAWAIATAGDALARAYATAHMGVSGIQNDGSDAKKPALAAAVQQLAEAHENATFGISGIQNDGSDAKKPELAAAVQRLAEAHENATFGISGIQNDGSDAKHPAMAEAVKALGEGAGAARQLIAAPRGLMHKDGQQEHKVAALLFSPRTGIVQQLYFDVLGQPHLTPPLEAAP